MKRRENQQDGCKQPSRSAARNGAMAAVLRRTGFPLSVKHVLLIGAVCTVLGIHVCMRDGTLHALPPAITDYQELPRSHISIHQVGAAPHHQNLPVRFIVMSKQHSGTHMMKRVLSQVPDGVMLDEVMMGSRDGCFHDDGSTAGASSSTTDAVAQTRRVREEIGLSARLDLLYGIQQYQGKLNSSNACLFTNGLSRESFKRFMTQQQQQQQHTINNADNTSRTNVRITNVGNNATSSPMTDFLRAKRFIGFLWNCNYWPYPDASPPLPPAGQYTEPLDGYRRAWMKLNANNDSFDYTVYRGSSWKCGKYDIANITTGKSLLSKMLKRQIDYMKTRNVRVVLLERENEIATSLSGSAECIRQCQQAKQKDEAQGANNVSDLRHVDVQSVDAFARSRHRLFAGVFSAFEDAGIPTLHVTYEELLKNPSTFTQVFRFIGVDDVKLLSTATNSSILLGQSWNFTLSQSTRHHTGLPIDYIENAEEVTNALPKLEGLNECMLENTCMTKPLRYANAGWMKDMYM